MSAGSHTEPGGYTKAGATDLHRTVKGRRENATGINADSIATSQFEISDNRSPAAIASMLHNQNYEPIWKDWDEEFLNEVKALSTSIIGSS